jgi:uroporphyrinogen decarboxylase
MTARDDMIAALDRSQIPRVVPIWELEFHGWDRASSKHIVIGEEFEGLTAGEKNRALHTNAEIFLAVSEKMHYSALTIPSRYWEVAPGIPAYYWLSGEWRYRQANVINQLAKNDIVLVANCTGILGMPYNSAEDYVEFALRLFDAPEEIDILAQNTLQDGIRSAQRFRENGVEIGLSTSDIADNHSTFMAPHQLERFVWPYLVRWSTALKELEMFSILHSDGNLIDCLEIIADSGVDALQAIDPTAGMDMWDTKQKVGNKLCLCGNIDCALLLTGTPDQVYEVTRTLLIKCKAGGNLVLGASNAVQPEVPLENYLAMISAWKQYGSYLTN